MNVGRTSPAFAGRYQLHFKDEEEIARKVADNFGHVKAQMSGYLLNRQNFYKIERRGDVVEIDSPFRDYCKSDVVLLETGIKVSMPNGKNEAQEMGINSIGGLKTGAITDEKGNSLMNQIRKNVIASINHLGKE